MISFWSVPDTSPEIGSLQIIEYPVGVSTMLQSAETGELVVNMRPVMKKDSNRLLKIDVYLIMPPSISYILNFISPLIRK